MVFLTCRYLSKFFQLFRRFDVDHNGVLNEQEFRQLVLALGSKTEAQVQRVVRAVDPHGHQMISFSECVVALGVEISNMR